MLASPRLGANPDQLLAVNWLNVTFLAGDFAGGLGWSALGVGIMMTSPMTGPLAPGAFYAGFGTAGYGAYQMYNANVGLRNEFLGTDFPTVLQGIGRAIGGDTGNAVGSILDVAFGILRPGAINPSTWEGAADAGRFLNDVYQLNQGRYDPEP
jgi:hypothetical protein